MIQNAANILNFHSKLKLLTNKILTISLSNSAKKLTPGLLGFKLSGKL